MNDLLNPFTSIPILIPIVEMLAMIYLSRQQIKRPLTWIMGSYLLSIALTLALALYPYKEETFGYNWIPFLLITEPWHLLVPRSLPKLASYAQSIYGVSFGILLNCAIFYILGKVSYPKHSARLSGRQATQRSPS